MTITTQQKRQVIDITERIEAELDGSGLVNIFVQHTTCAITVADLDPGTDQDYLTALEAITPNVAWNHPHDPAHFPDHLWSSLVGSNTTLPYRNGSLQLGGWQRVILIELDGPRDREVVITTVKAN